MDWGQGETRTRVLFAFGLLFLLAVFGSASAQTPDSVKGVSWLAAQIQSDGSLVGESGSIATSLQAREESLLALKTLVGAPSALVSAVAADADANIEYTSRRILAAAASGVSSGTAATTLMSQQNNDGGWGLSAGYPSDALDTAIVLQALAAVNGSAAAAANALAFLAQSKLPDGGWGVVDVSSVYITANVLLASQAWPNQGATVASTATNWLLASRDASTHEYADVFTNAVGLLALSTQPGQSSALAPLITTLASTQTADGSWQDDPYITALVLRAIWSAGQAPPPTTGSVTGFIVDQASSAPLSGATITLVENSGFGTTSGSDGSFRLNSVVAANYTLQVTRRGYQPQSASIKVVAGQTLNLGSIALQPISTTATLTGSVKDGHGVPLQNVVVTVASKSTLTDGTGTYQIIGIPAGTATVSATLSGYQTVSATVSFVAATTYLFSPTMYSSTVTPPPASAQGVVTDGKTGIAIAGASVMLNGLMQTTDAAGTFLFSGVTAGAYLMTVSATGYQSATVSVSIASGVNNFGSIPLQPTASTSTLHGYVLDAQGNPIPSAIIAVANGPSTAGDFAGAYQLADIVGIQFTISVSAVGYVPQSFVFTVSAPGDYAQDFQLVAEQVTNVTLGPLTVSPESGGANTDLNVSSALLNGGEAIFSGVLLLEVYDSSGNLIGTGPLTDAQGFSLAVVNLQPGESIGIRGRWNTGQFAPGVYQFELRLVEADSVIGATPLGVLIENQYASFAITPLTHFTGTVTADPPVLQAGLDQAVHLTAVLRNDGNVLFEAQSMQLTVADVKTGAVAFTASASSDSLTTNALAALDFGSWKPQSGGNYNLTISAMDPSAGNISGNLYVGNVAQAAFTVNPDTVLAGTRKTTGNIHVTGVDPAEATVSDPLAPLIRTAIQSAVNYNDVRAHSWIDAHSCESCHIGNQALVGGELTRKLASYSVLDRRAIINNIAANERRDGRGYDGTVTAGDYDNLSGIRRLSALAFWGLTAYHDLPELRTVVKHAADWAVSAQAGNGNWSSDENKVWFDSDISMSMLNLSSMSRTVALLKDNAISTVPSYSAQFLESTLPISSRGFLTVAPDGNVYCSDRTGPAVNLLRPDGSLITKWTKLGTSAINDPRSVAVLKDGQVWLASNSGTLRLNADGTTTKLSSDSMNTLAVDTQGNVWGTKAGDPRSIYKVDPHTAQSVAWISNGPFAQATLGRITPDDDGSLYVTDLVNGKIYQVFPDKTVSTVTEIIQGYQAIPQLLDILKDGDHWLVSTSVGVFRLSADWIAQRITWSRADQMARMGDGTVIYVAYQSAGIRKLVITNEDAVASLARYQHSIDIGEQWLRGQSIPDAQSMHLAQKLWGLGEAYRYFSKFDAVRASLILSSMKSIAIKLRANQAADGGWGRTTNDPSDALVTAQAGIALDYLNPSASDPSVRRAVVWLLSKQQPDGSWSSADQIMTTNVSTTTMVAIWLPMILDRLGAIDAQVSVTFPPKIQPSTFTPVPSQSTTDAAGNITATWSLTGVTNDGIDLGFDLTMLDLLPNEVRPAASEAHIQFNNSFNQQAVQQPIDIPDVTATAPVSLTVATDRPQYPSNSTAQVTTTLVNLDDVEIDGALVVNVYDAAGGFVGTVTQRNVTIPAGGTLPINDPFAIGTIAPAPYTVKAVLSNGGIVLAQGDTTFTVLPDNLAAAATSTVHTDRQTYNPSDQVQILSRVLSQTDNVTLSDLSLVVGVFDSANSQQFSHTYSIPQLLPKQSLDLSVPEALINAPPGIYTVKQDLFSKEGDRFNHVEAAYNVSSTSDTGFGLVGEIAAAPKAVHVGRSVTLAASATNKGNGALTNLPLTISIVDPVTGVVVKQFAQTSSIAIGATVPFDGSWATQGQPDQTLFAVLSATIGTGSSAKTVTLAVDSFQLIVHLDATVTLKAAKAPLAALVLVNPTLSPAQAARIGATLTALNYAGTFVSSPDTFATGVRSGAYQLYLLLATQVAPDTTTLRLLREAVHRGEGVLSASGAAALPDSLAQISGVTASKGLPVINAQLMDVLSSAPGATAQITFDPPMPARIVEPQLAQTQAVLTGRLPNVPDQGALSDEVAALGRVDIGYFGTDEGTGNSYLSLASMGRIRNVDGSDRYTVWRVRNSGDTARNVSLTSVVGGYVQMLTIAAHADAFVTSPIVSGSADHRLLEATQTIQTIAALTSIFSDARVVDVGDNPGAIALWANQIGSSDALQWPGGQETVHGAVHSNGDIRLSGAQNQMDGPIHYVGNFTSTGSQNTFTFQPRRVEAQPMPTLLKLEDFKPGGAVAIALGERYIDATAECASSNHGWQRNSSQMPIASGVYWIPCDVHVSGGNGTTSNVTLVSSAAMQIDGVKGIFQPYYQQLQFATTSTSTAAIQLSGDSTQIGGVVFAPNGTVQVNGSTLSLACSVIGNEIRFANAKTTIDARRCAYATVQRQSPAILLNAFGQGWAAYAAYDWLGALAQYDPAGTGELAGLFGGVLAEVAPLQNSLRAGSIVPLTASVQNNDDPFHGTLGIAANDDSAFIPATASWVVDFSTQDSYQVQSNVRLGTGTSTDITATVGAATPIIVDPLAQSTATIAHLPGESISELITVVSAIGEPDAGLTAALAALVSARTSEVANDREAEVNHLLDAAEACGESTNGQADDLRTRVDWLLWSATH